MLELVYEPLASGECVDPAGRAGTSRPTDKLVARRYLLHFSLVRRSEGAHDATRRGRAKRAKARQGKAVIFQPLLGRGAPAETGRGENLFDSPLRALIHWHIPYLATCSLFLISSFLLSSFLFSFFPAPFYARLFPTLSLSLFLSFSLSIPLSSLSFRPIDVNYGRYFTRLFLSRSIPFTGSDLNRSDICLPSLIIAGCYVNYWISS